jgi:poly(A) polymerase
LKLSNKARKRLASAATPWAQEDPHALAYEIGTEGSVDRLLLAGRAADAATIASWPVPRLPLGGGALIERGVARGPEVAATLRRIERLWIERGFPAGDAFDKLVDEALASPR